MSVWGLLESAILAGTTPSPTTGGSSMKSVSKLATVVSSETLYEALKVGSDFVSSLRTELEVDVSEPKDFDK